MGIRALEVVPSDASCRPVMYSPGTLIFAQEFVATDLSPTER